MDHRCYWGALQKRRPGVAPSMDPTFAVTQYFIFLCWPLTLPTLRESNDKDEINDKESQQISLHHLIDHHHEWSDYLKSSEIKMQHKVEVSPPVSVWSVWNFQMVGLIFFQVWWNNVEVCFCLHNGSIGNAIFLILPALKTTHLLIGHTMNQLTMALPAKEEEVRCRAEYSKNRYNILIHVRTRSTSRHSQDHKHVCHQEHCLRRWRCL